MGPGDRHVKWSLTADIIPTNNIGVGSCVYHPEEGNDQLGVIIEVAEDGKTCTIKYEKDGACSSGLSMENLRSYDGQLEFDVHRLNVQGGGILKCSKLVQVVNNSCGLSMKWLTPVSEKKGDCNPGECWYFDPEHQDINLSNVFTDEPFIKGLISQNLDIIEGEDGEDGLIVEQQLLLISYLGMPKELCIRLLSTPFLLYEDIVVDYLLLLFQGKVDVEDKIAKKRLEEMDLDLSNWREIFHAVIVSGMYLRQDPESHRAYSKCDVVLSDEVRDIRDDTSLYRIIDKIGEWFEEQKDYRAAIWCYNLNLKSVRDGNVCFPLIALNESLISQLCNIGLSNKRMDNFVEASKYYEEAIVECSSAHSSAFSRADVKKELMKLLTGNAKKLQEEAKEWFGTSRAITSWKTVDDDDTCITVWKCQSCGSDGAAKKCSACKVAYCNVECQSNHWKLVHKRTCLGKLKDK
jgi:hypothetical protein